MKVTFAAIAAVMLAGCDGPTWGENRAILGAEPGLRDLLCAQRGGG